MTNYFRKAWTIPDRVFDVLEHFTPEVGFEVLSAVRAYSHYWDLIRSDEGFDFDFSSDLCRAVFLSVYNELKDLNFQYFLRCSAMADNAMVGQVKRKQKEVKRKKQNRYYENHRDAINSRRRSKYAKVSGKTKRSDENTEEVKQKGSDERVQSVADKDVARNSAIAHKIIGLNNNPSLRSELLLGNGDCKGEGSSCPQSHHEPPQPQFSTDSLSSNKAGQTVGTAPVCSKAVGSNGIAGSKGIKGSMAVGNKEQGSRHGAFGCIGKAVTYSADDVCADAGADNSHTIDVLSAPHMVREGEVLITRDFKIDFRDEIFGPYYRADRFLRQGVEDWLKDNKLGCSVEKRWIARLIYNFAKRQGKVGVLMGVEDV